MPPFPAQDRLIRKEVALGTLREMEPPQTHIGTRLIAPMKDVGSDDVIFDYARGLTDGLAPARAEDAESELAQKDLQYGGVGRASVIDWALKDHYDASDVTRYRETLLVQQRLGANMDLPLTVGNMVEEFRGKVARDDALRRRKLDNRIEWMIMQAVETGGIAYNDGKIKFSIDYGRPANQTDEAPPGGTWNLTTSDPIGDILAIDEFMYDTYGVHIGRAIASRKVLNSILNSDRFAARSGLAIASSPVGSTGGTPIDPNYLIDGWGPRAAQQLVERATGVQFIEYDAVYRTRPVGSNVVTNNRFLSDKKVYFFPREADLAELDDTEIGFAKTLTSPHPEGNWTSGFYEWERATEDPWGQDRGTGIKAFPVFLHLDLTYTMQVLP
jgi:hypothetical protein